MHFFEHSFLHESAVVSASDPQVHDWIQASAGPDLPVQPESSDGQDAGSGTGKLEVPQSHGIFRLLIVFVGPNLEVRYLAFCMYIYIYMCVFLWSIPVFFPASIVVFSDLTKGSGRLNRKSVDEPLDFGFFQVPLRGKGVCPVLKIEPEAGGIAIFFCITKPLQIDIDTVYQSLDMFV